MLRDCGIRDVKLQQRFLAKSKLTFQESFEMAQAAEVAEQNTKELQAGKMSSSSATETVLEWGTNLQVWKVLSLQWQPQGRELSIQGIG